MAITGRDTARFYNIWDELSGLLLNENRHFNRKAEVLLQDLFCDIGGFELPNGTSLISEIGPECEIFELYRGRSFSTLTELPAVLRNPDQLIGPPPARYAGNGRLNAQHQSVFYGALEKETAFAEIRPPVGSYLACARFQILKELRVLNLSDLREILDNGELFDAIEGDCKPKLANLMLLGEHMAKPVQPGNNSIEYILTQAIADYLSSLDDPSLDGISYRSSQNPGGKNIVLFHKSSRVAPVSNETELLYTRLLHFDRTKKLSADVPLNEETASLHRLLRHDGETIAIELVQRECTTINDGIIDRRSVVLSTSAEMVSVDYVESIKVEASAVPCEFSQEKI